METLANIIYRNLGASPVLIKKRVSREAVYCVVQEFTQQCYSTDTCLKAGQIQKDSSSSREQMDYTCPLPVLSTPDRAWDQSTPKE